FVDERPNLLLRLRDQQRIDRGRFVALLPKAKRSLAACRGNRFGRAHEVADSRKGDGSSRNARSAVRIIHLRAGRAARCRENARWQWSAAASGGAVCPLCLASSPPQSSPAASSERES